MNIYAKQVDLKGEEGDPVEGNYLFLEDPKASF